MRLLILFLVSTACYAQGLLQSGVLNNRHTATYYVDQTLGSDSNAGTRQLPFKTVAKVNTLSPTAGQRVAFKRAETWRETLTVPTSGTAGLPITFAAYGSGAKPVIDGYPLPAGIAAETGGVFSSGFEGEVDACSTEFYNQSVAGGNTIVMSAAAAEVHYGIKAMKATFAGSSPTARCYKYSAAAQTDIYLRFFFRINQSFALTAGSTAFTFFQYYDFNSGIRAFDVELMSLGNTQPLYLYAYGQDNSATAFSPTAAVPLPIVSPLQWHMVEIHWVASATVGGFSIAYDGVTIGSDFTHANEAIVPQAIYAGGPTAPYVGGIPAAGSILYIDDVKLSQTGPLSNYASNLVYGVDLGSQSYIKLDGLQVQNAKTAGVRINGGTNNVIQNNLVQSSPMSYHIPVPATADGILVMGSGANSNVIQRNEVARNLRHGVYFAGAETTAASNLLSHNLVYLNQGSGIQADASQTTNLIYNNTLDGNNYGAYFGGTSGFTLKNNLFSRNITEELFAPAGADLTHSNNSFWRPGTGNTATFDSANYTTATITNLEATAVAANPRTDAEVDTGQLITGSWITATGTAYAFDNHSHVLTSTNGTSWTTAYTFTGDANLASNMVFVDAAGYIYVSPASAAAQTLQGIYRSTNAGASFTRVLDLSAFSAQAYIWSMTQDASGNLFAGLYSTAAGAGYAYIYKSTDGETWTESYSDANARHVHSVSADASTGYIYASLGDMETGSASPYLLRSTDSGANWSKILVGMPQIVATLAGSGFRLFGTDNLGMLELYRTTDDAAYSLVLSIPAADLTKSSFPTWTRTDAAGNVYVGTQGNVGAQNYIYKSSDNGVTWQLSRLTNGAALNSGFSTASNIVNGRMYLELIGAALTTGIGFSAGHEGVFTLPAGSPAIGAASDGGNIGAK